MKGYITAIAATAVLSAFCDILIPKGWGKYIGILTGAVLLLTLISPILKLRAIKPPSFDLPQEDYIEYDLDAEIAAELERRVEEDVRTRLKSEFGSECTVRAEIDSEDGAITGVERIILGCDYSAAIAARLGEVYGCEVIFNG